MMAKSLLTAKGGDVNLCQEYLAQACIETLETLHSEGDLPAFVFFHA